MTNYLYSVPYLVVFFLLFLINFSLTTTGLKTTLYHYAAVQKYLLFSLLIIFIGFRGFVLSDWLGYYPLYNRTPTLFSRVDYIKNFLITGGNVTLFERPFERGFLVYAIVCKTISTNYFFFQLISAIIDIIILYYFFKTYIPNNIIMGFIFFFLFQGLLIEINLLRNTKAIMFFLISIKYIKEKRVFMYMGLNLIGCLFHISSFIYLPLYFFLNKQYSKKVILILFFLGNIIFLFSIEWIKEVLISLSVFFTSNSRLALTIHGYLSSEFHTTAYGFSVGYFERTMSFFIIFIFYDKLIRISKSNIIFINSIFIYWFIYLFFSEMYILLQRLPSLFIFSYWIIYPQIYNILSKEKKYLFLILLIVYGGLKLMGYSGIEFVYENVLFGYNSYDQRKIIEGKFLKEWKESRNK
jgi:hypothetical protein